MEGMVSEVEQFIAKYIVMSSYSSTTDGSQMVSVSPRAAISLACRQNDRFAQDRRTVCADCGDCN